MGFPSVRWPLLATNAILLLGGGLLLFIFLAFIQHAGLEQSIKTNDVRRALRENLFLIERVLSEIKDLETGQRGFLLTGEEAYLEPYQAVRENVVWHYAHLRTRVEERLPQDDAFWPAVDTQFNRRVEIVDEAIRLRRAGLFDLGRYKELLDQGKAAMDALRQAFASIEESHRDGIAALNTRIDDLRDQSRVTTVIVGALGTLLIAGGLAAFVREQRRRQAVEAGLEAQVAERTAELRQAIERIEVFASRLDRSIEDERRRLAREVHDQIGQFFTGLKLMARTWQNRFPDDPALQEQLGHFMAQLDEGVATARRIASELRPPLLDELGLGAALAHYAARAVTPAGLACEINLTHDHALGLDQASALFRIAQEALTNILRHANAQHVWIRDGFEDRIYMLCISDDGSGFTAAFKKNEGMLGMEERARLIGGQLEVRHGETPGARIYVRLPMARQGGEQRHEHLDR